MNAIEQFLHDLDRQTDLYRSMLGTTEVPRLQELMSEIAAIDARLLPVRRRWADVARTLDADTAGRAGRSIEAAKEVLASLLSKFVPPAPRRIGDVYGG